MNLLRNSIIVATPIQTDMTGTVFLSHKHQPCIDYCAMQNSGRGPQLRSCMAEGER